MTQFNFGRIIEAAKFIKNGGTREQLDADLQEESMWNFIYSIVLKMQSA